MAVSSGPIAPSFKDGVRLRFELARHRNGIETPPFRTGLLQDEVGILRRVLGGNVFRFAPGHTTITQLLRNGDAVNLRRMAKGQYNWAILT